MKKKIILGTAQFFSNYGIANKKKTNKKIVKSILNYAYKKNIRYLDTAISYKNCDKNLGKIGVRKWKIITKVNFPIDGDKMDIKKKVLRSMRELKINKFYGILVHNSCAVSKISFLNNYKEKNNSDDNKIKTEINSTIKKVTDNIDLFHYNKAIANIHEFINNAQKLIIKKTVSREEAMNSFKKLSLIIQPFIPHLSEEIWQKFGGEGLAIEQDWPQVNESLLVKNFNIAIQINGKTKDVLSATKELDKDSVVNILKENNKISRLLKDKRIVKTIYVSGKIINFVTN